MFELYFSIGIILFVALMWWLAGKWDDYTDKQADENTRIEQEKHDLYIALLKAHWKDKKKRGSE